MGLLGKEYDIGIDPDEYAESLEQERELPMFADLAITLGGPTAISAGLKRISSKLGGRALIANAVFGALYGGGKAIYEGRELGDIAKGAVSGAVEWPMYEGLGKLAYNTLKGFKAVGARKALKFGSEKTLQEIKTELAPVLNKKLGSDFLEKRFGARTVGDFIKTGREKLLESDDIAKQAFGKDIFMRPGQMDQISKGAEELITSMGEAGPKVQKDVLRVLGNELKKPLSMSEEDYTAVIPIIDKLKSAFTGTTERMSPGVSKYVKEKFYTNLTKDMLEISPRLGEFDSAILAKLEKEIQLGTPEGVQKQLEKIINNPLMDKEVVEAAKAFHSYPARTMQAVNDSYRKTLLGGLISSVKSNPNLSWEIGTKVTGPAAKTKFVTVGSNPFKGNPVADQIFNQLKDHEVDWDTYRAIFDIADASRYSDKLISRYLVRPWKITRAVASPQPLVRNLFGNFVLNAITGENPLSILNIKHYVKALKELNLGLKGKGPATKFLDIVGADRLTFRAELDKLESYLEKQGPTRNIADQLLEWFYGGGSKFNIPGKIIKGAENFYGQSELLAKYAKYTWNLKHGMTADKALYDAVAATFDYGDVTPFVRMLREGPMPFATFATKMAVRVPEAILKNPTRVAPYVVLPWLITQASLKNLNVSDEEYERVHKSLPDYMQDGHFMLLPFRDDKGRLQMFDLTWWLPGLETTNMRGLTDPKQWISNPLFTVIRDIQANQKGLTSAPIYNEFDTQGVKLGKSLNYIYQQLLPIPTWTPPLGMAPGLSTTDTWIPGAAGGINWRNYLDYMNDKQTAMTPAQVVSTGVGLKVTPIDEALTASKKQKGYDRVLRDLETQMKKEIADAPADAEHIIKKYEYIRSSLISKMRR